MELEKQVCSFDLANRLKELGVKQNGYLAWVENRPTGSFHLWNEEMRAMRYMSPEDGRRKPLKEYSAFSVAELGEMLPRTIESKDINAAYPMPDLPGDIEGGEWERIEETREAMREKLSDVFGAFEGNPDQFEEGMPYDIRLSYNDGKEVSYHQLTDDWENNCPVIEKRASTEADARGKMLIYLLENNLLAVPLKPQISRHT